MGTIVALIVVCWLVAFLIMAAQSGICPRRYGTHSWSHPEREWWAVSHWEHCYHCGEYRRVYPRESARAKRIGLLIAWISFWFVFAGTIISTLDW